MACHPLVFFGRICSAQPSTYNTMRVFAFIVYRVYVVDGKGRHIFFLWGLPQQSLEQQLVNVKKTTDEKESCTHVCLFFSAPNSMNGWIRFVHAMACGYVRVWYEVLKVQSYHKKRCACRVPYKYREKLFSHPIPCNPVIYQSRPVQSRGISIPSREIPWYLNPVPCNPVISQSRPNYPVQSRYGSIPSCTVPWLKYPFLSRPLESQDISIPRDPVLRRKFCLGESPENKETKKENKCID